MHLNRGTRTLIVFTLFTAGCIEPYIPRIGEDPGNYYVVSGTVTDQEGYQLVDISTASLISKAEYLPVSGCLVEIQDDKGNVFEGEQIDAGKYRVWMNAASLSAGTAYRVHITTGEGAEIISAYDTMPEPAVLDSVYFERTELPTTDPDQFTTGIQFYLDMRGSGTDSRFYRWGVEATWEYHAAYPKEYYYDGSIKRVFPPDYSQKVCWLTETIRTVFTLDTRKLVSNSYKRLPLHFVDNTTTRLYEGYYLKVDQYALSKPAYDFWEQLRINGQEQGGLYDKQPLAVEGNLHHVTNPGQKVLGYFGASGVSRKEIFVHAIRDMGIYYDSICGPMSLGRMGWREYPPYFYPVYIVYIRNALQIIDKSCVECTYSGGTNVKPDFWKW